MLLENRAEAPEAFPRAPRAGALNLPRVGEQREQKRSKQLLRRGES